MKTIEISNGEEKLLMLGLKAFDKDLKFMEAHADRPTLKANLKEIRLDVQALINKLKK